MEEDEYKSTYRQIAAVACVFEKALTNNHAKCSHARHFCLADREGYACQSESSAAICSDLLKNLRENSQFSLKLKKTGGPLPHNMDIRVQVGGLQGLQQVLAGSAGLDDIHKLVARTLEKFDGLNALPYTEIVQSVVKFQGRKRRSRQGV